MIRVFLAILLVVICAPLGASVKPDTTCIRLAYEDYTAGVREYWGLVGEKLKATDEKLYDEFSYIVTEQLNSAEMSKIALSYLIERHPFELKLDQKLSLVVPAYSNYQQGMFRELRKIPEYNRLYLENDGYRHNIRMPDFDRLTQVSQMLVDIQRSLDVLEKFKQVQAKGDRAVSALKCNL